MPCGSEPASQLNYQIEWCGSSIPNGMEDASLAKRLWNGQLGISRRRNPAAPWMFYNAASGVLMEVRMDDFYATGPKAALEELEKKLREKILK